MDQDRRIEQHADGHEKQDRERIAQRQGFFRRPMAEFGSPITEPLKLITDAKLKKWSCLRHIFKHQFPLTTPPSGVKPG